MPPKKKQPSDKAKSPEGKSAKEAPPTAGEAQGEVEGTGEPVLSERESIFQQGNKQLALNMESLRKRLDMQRHDKEFLQGEAQRIQVENQEYMSHMSKRTQKCENAIITLSDQNQRELEDIRRQQEELQTNFMEKEAQLNDLLLQQEAKLAQVNQEIEDLQPVKNLQLEQIDRIKELEQEVMTSRAMNADTLLKIKRAFLQGKAAYVADSEQQVLALAKEAGEEAERFMKQHNEGVVQENQQLHQQLLHLIRRSRVLQAHKLHLKVQNMQLIQESQYSQTMERCRRRQQLPPFSGAATSEKPRVRFKGLPEEPVNDTCNDHQS
ncbi:coiled-coil domain-containing protein 166-like [Lissotriton helveticus]